MQKFFALLAVAALTACTSARPVPMPTPQGFNPVVPGGTMKVGHLYFSGRGTYPAFTTAQGTLYSEFCWRDFAADAVLMNIASYVEAVPDPLTTFSGGTSGSFLLGLDGIASGEGSASGAATVGGIKRLTLNPQGVAAVFSNIGDGCKSDIASYLERKHDVVLLVSAQRADSMTLSSDAKLKVEAALGGILGLTPAKAGADAKQSLDYAMVYLSASLGSPKPGGQ